MNTVIFFMSKHGTTEKVAEILRQYLNSSNVEIVNLKLTNKVSPKPYDTVIIGGSIHAGSIQKGITKFIKRNYNTLQQKKLGLFLCCMEDDETCIKEFNKAYPQDLRNYAQATGVLGGEFLFDKMNFIERAITRKITGHNKNVSNINRDAIRQFAEKMTI